MYFVVSFTNQKKTKMQVKPIPEGYHTLTPYLVVDDVDILMDFLKNAFNADERFRMPGPDGKAMHAEMKIGNSHIMLGAAKEGHEANNSMIYMYVEDTDATYKQAVAAGGESLMEPADQFYGDRNAGIKGPMGNSWWIATHVEDVPDEEMAKRAQEYAQQN